MSSLLCFAAAVSGSASSTTQPATDAAPAASQTPKLLRLEPAAYPAGISDETQYEKSLTRGLRQLQAEVGTLGDPEAKADACLRLAAFALTKGTEPGLSRLWLARPDPGDVATARRFLDAARTALDEADRIRLGEEEAEQDVTQLATGIERLSALADLLAVLIETAEKDAALEAADKADASLEDLPESAQPAWNLLIAGCLQRAGKHQAALLRLQPLLRQREQPRTALAAAVLQCRILADAGNHAAALALVSEYLQKMPFATTDQPQTRPQPGASQPLATNRSSKPGPAAAPHLPSRTARCTLTLFKANLLENWGAKLTRSANPSDRQAALTLRRTAVKMRKQAESLGPNLMRLSPVLAKLANLASAE